VTSFTRARDAIDAICASMCDYPAAAARSQAVVAMAACIGDLCDAAGRAREEEEEAERTQIAAQRMLADLANPSDEVPVDPPEEEEEAPPPQRTVCIPDSARLYDQLIVYRARTKAENDWSSRFTPNSSTNDNATKVPAEASAEAPAEASE